jgi:anhydro-N-acetylmuramic acid kinase
MAAQPELALGLMSGTSLDGIDAALVRTDGEDAVKCGAALTVPYDGELRDRLRGVLRRPPGTRCAEVEAVARDLTRAHAGAVARLLEESGVAGEAVRVIGFHGHTILHRPRERITVQIGDADLLAELTGIDVVDDFRSQDMANGGEGAPLTPLFHAALARSAGVPGPLAVLNIGGVANVTWIGAERPDGGGTDLVAFDTGPGNALIDDWVRARTGHAFDRDGALAAVGRIHEQALRRLLDDPFFARSPPKSLDRGDFDLAALDGLSPEDGAATLTSFTAEAVALASRFFPAPPRSWLVTGGGRSNPALMAALKRALEAEVRAVEELGWNGDALEAQAFAYLAVRSLRGLPLTLPATTGVDRPMTGGRLHKSGGRG